MTRPLAALAVAALAGTVAAVGDPPTPPPGELVARLGAPAYPDREAATQQLDALGPAALIALRVGCRSADPEVSRRAAELYARIERRVTNEKTLAPTVVTLAADAAPLADVLADLSKRSGYAVTLAAGVPTTRPVTVKTGEVPFWTAVRAVCDAAGLQVLYAGIIRPNGPAAVSVRYVVILAARPVGQPPRPAAVYGAVLVEAVPPPAEAGRGAALLHVWPEPKLNWEQSRGLKVEQATDPAGRRVVPEPEHVDPPEATVVRRVVRQANGKLVANAGVVVVSQPPAFSPGSRQAVAKFRLGDNPPSRLGEFRGAVLGQVRSGVEPLAVVELTGDNAAAAVGKAGASLRAAVVRKDDGRVFLQATVRTANRAVLAGPSDTLPGVRGSAGRRVGDHTVYGVRLTDKDGLPFELHTQEVTNQTDPAGGTTHIILQMQVFPIEKGQGEPHTATLWGTYLKPVEVPFQLRDVPTGGGK